MPLVNRRLGVPDWTASYWVGAVGANQVLWDANTGLCARILVVGVVGAGPLNVTEVGGVARSYTAAEINAAGGILRGNFESLVAAGSVSHTITAGR